MRLKHIYIFLVAVLAVFAGYAAVRNARILIHQGSFFTVRQVEVTGLKLVAPETLVRLSGLTSGVSLVFVSIAKLTKSIEADARFKVESMERRFPDTLVIRVTERDGDYIVYDGKNAFEHALSGFLIASNEGILNWDKLIVRSTGTTHDQENDSLKSLLTGLHQLPEGERDFPQSLSEIVWAPDLRLYTRKGKTRLDLGTHTDLATLRKARYALVYAESEGFTPRRIDLRYETVKFTL